MKEDRVLFNYIEMEKRRQQSSLELIASENFVSDQVLSAAGSVLTNKYAEGYPGSRYYGGCEFVDLVEQLAIDRVKDIFGVQYANVQPHSGSQANAAVFSACLKPGDKILGFDLAHGGHLTHGSPVNFSGKIYTSVSYGVDRISGILDYDAIEKTALQERPQIIIAGATAYSRDIDFKRFREIADKAGSILLADISHPAGLIAKQLLNDPVPHCHIITTTTHKTLRGPRGGIIMMGKDFENPFGIRTAKGDVRMMSALLDSGVFPGNQGGPLMHVIAAKAAAFGEIITDDFRLYAAQVKKNAAAMSDGFLSLGYNVVSGGTDNHLMLLDLRNKGISGKDADAVLGEAGITVNKNMVPYDDKSPFITSGIRLGTAALTTRGLKEKEMADIVEIIDQVLKHPSNKSVIRKSGSMVVNMMQPRPIFTWH